MQELSDYKGIYYHSSANQKVGAQFRYEDLYSRLLYISRGAEKSYCTSHIVRNGSLQYPLKPILKGPLKRNENDITVYQPPVRTICIYETNSTSDNFQPISENLIGTISSRNKAHIIKCLSNNLLDASSITQPSQCHKANKPLRRRINAMIF